VSLCVKWDKSGLAGLGHEALLRSARRAKLSKALCKDGQKLLEQRLSIASGRARIEQAFSLKLFRCDSSATAGSCTTARTRPRHLCPARPLSVPNVVLSNSMLMICFTLLQSDDDMGFGLFD
jgi:hypothetical protein